MQRLCCTPLPPIGLLLCFLIFFPKEDCNNIKAFVAWEELCLKGSSNNEFIITLQKTKVKYIDKTGNNSFTSSCLRKNPWLTKQVAQFIWRSCSCSATKLHHVSHLQWPGTSENGSVMTFPWWLWPQLCKSRKIRLQAEDLGNE